MSDINKANREQRNLAEAASFKLTREHCVVEGGYEAVRERVSSIKAAATEHFEAGRVDIALSGYLMGIHMCVGGNYPNTICPATSPTPAGRVLLLALRFLGGSADGVDPASLAALRLNVALCCLKREDWLPATEAASEVIDSAGDVVARTKARLRLAKARGEMGYTHQAERCLRKVIVDATKPNACGAARCAARDALAYLKILKVRQMEAKQVFGKMFDGKDVFYKEEETAHLRKQAKMDANARMRLEAGRTERDQMQTAHLSFEKSQNFDWSKVLEARNDPNFERNRMLYRLSANDANIYNAMDESGASESQLREFYLVSRRQERNRIAALMSHDDRHWFQHLLACGASHEELDNCFDTIKRATERREEARATKQIWFDDNERPTPARKRQADKVVSWSPEGVSAQDGAQMNPVVDSMSARDSTSHIPRANENLTGKPEFELVVDMARWRFRPKREEKKEVTSQEKADLQLSIDRQMEQAGLAHPTSPVQNFVTKWKFQILNVFIQARRFIKHVWRVSKRSRRPLTEETKRRRTSKLVAALHQHRLS